MPGRTRGPSSSSFSRFSICIRLCLLPSPAFVLILTLESQSFHFHSGSWTSISIWRRRRFSLIHWRVPSSSSCGRTLQIEHLLSRSSVFGGPLLWAKRPVPTSTDISLSSSSHFPLTYKVFPNMPQARVSSPRVLRVNPIHLGSSYNPSEQIWNTPSGSSRR